MDAPANELHDAKVLAGLVHTFAGLHPESAAQALEKLDVAQAVRVIESLDPAVVGPVLERINPADAGAILDRLGHERAAALLGRIGPKHAASVLQYLDPARRDEALAALDASKAGLLRDLLRYAPETAGGMMELQVVTIPVDLTVEEAIAVLRRAPRQALYYLYVTDRQGKLVGVLNMRDLLLASPGDKISGFVRTGIVSVPAYMDREEVAELMRQHNFLAIPVVDGEGRLVGVLRPDRVVSAAQQEAFEDMQRMVGAGGDERATSPVGAAVRKRLPWLLVNLLTAFLAAAVVGLFEGIIAKVTALAVLLPIVAGQSGNAGAQALAVVMRGLALREILPDTMRRVVFKEFAAGVLNGVIVAAVTGVAVLAWDGRPMLALVIGLAMILSMAAAGAAGAAIPIVLRRLGRDPAQSSSIFLTTVTDIVGFATFLGFAVLFASRLT
ncbi:MAG: magnesium transporter [Deltaproteobacteria bacterium]|nr:magnesium transporter [Deltaproteobacteria bacterium]